MLKKSLFLAISALICQSSFAADVDKDVRQLTSQSYRAQLAQHYDEAKELSLRALSLAESEPGFPPQQLANILIQLAELSQQQNQPDSARNYSLRVLEIVNTPLQVDVQFKSYCLTRIAEISTRAGDPVYAENTAKNAANLIETMLGKDSEHLIGALGELGAAYLAQGNITDASKVIERALKLTKTPAQGTYYKNLFDYAARLYKKTGNLEKANAMEIKAASVFPPPVPSKISTPAALNQGSCKLAYPLEAVRYELTGLNHTQVVIDSTGVPILSRITRSSGWTLLDKAALEGFKQCRFRPALAGQNAVASSLTMEYRWKLDFTAPSVPPTLITNSCTASSEFSIAPDDSESTLRLRFLLDKEGKPQRVVVDSPTTSTDLDQRAIRFIESCRYQLNKSTDGSVTDSANVKLNWKS